MRLLVASDLHGSPEAAAFLRRRCEELLPDMLVLLGDYLYHGPRNPLPSSYGPPSVVSVFADFDTPIVAVRGNCDAEVDQMVLDFPCMADYALVEVDGHELYLAHGHLGDPPRLAPGSACLSGHTHVKTLDNREGVLYVNPGSTSIPKDGAASYAVYESNAFKLKTLEGAVLAERGW